MVSLISSAIVVATMLTTFSNSQQENEIKLNLLQALTDSQRAIAKMMQHVSDIVAVSEPTARHVLANIQVMTKYQKALADHIVHVSLRSHRVQGSPSTPWILPSAQIKKVH